MTNSTETFWEVDGESLQTYAFNIATLGGDRMAPPPLRGGNLIIPSAQGRKYQKKVVDERTITLGMWVVGALEDGTPPTDQSARRQFDENWRKLVQLLWTPDREFVLTKRFWVDGVLHTASAYGEYSGGLSPTMNGATRAVFTVDITLADPFFLGPVINESLTTGTQTVSVKGDARTKFITLHVDGPRNNVKVRNQTLGIDVEYHADLSSGDDLDIDVNAYTSITDPASTDPFNSIGSIRHTGDVSWLVLAPGDNSIVVSSSSGIGGIIMSYQEAWL